MARMMKGDGRNRLGKLKMPPSRAALDLSDLDQDDDDGRDGDDDRDGDLDGAGLHIELGPKPDHGDMGHDDGSDRDDLDNDLEHGPEGEHAGELGEEEGEHAESEDDAKAHEYKLSGCSDDDLMAEVRKRGLMKQLDHEDEGNKDGGPEDDGSQGSMY